MKYRDDSRRKRRRRDERRFGLSMVRNERIAMFVAHGLPASLNLDHMVRIGAVGSA